jgi:Fe2+ transport system protein B
MDAIDGFFGQLSEWVKATLPPGVLTDLMAEGIIAGIGGCGHIYPSDCLFILVYRIA